MVDESADVVLGAWALLLRKSRAGEPALLRIGRQRGSRDGSRSVTCCHCTATDRQFGDPVAQRDLRRYRRKGPDKTTGVLLEAVRSAGIRSASLLDVGAGVGVIHHELLDDVAVAAIHVEVASAYLEVARGEAKRRGQAERVRFVHGDFVELAEGLPESDIVTLDRVLCCYPDLEHFVETSVGKARRLYAASYPRDRWYVKLAFFIENLVRRMTGNQFRSYVHPVSRIHELLRAAGLKERFRRDTLVWQITTYSRDV